MSSHTRKYHADYLQLGDLRRIVSDCKSVPSRADVVIASDCIWVSWEEDK